MKWVLWLAQLLHGDSFHVTGQGGCSQTELTWQSCSVEETDVKAWEGTIPQLSDWQKLEILTALSIDRMWENRQAPSHMLRAIQTGKTLQEENLATHYNNYMYTYLLNQQSQFYKSTLKIYLNNKKYIYKCYPLHHCLQLQNTE